MAALAGVVVLCGVVGGTGWLVTTSPHGTGAPDPVSAAAAFMTAVYVHQDADEAAGYLCPAADPDDVVGRIDGVAKVTEDHDNVIYDWSAFTTVKATATEVTLATTLTRTARDLPTSAQALTIDVVENHGWWVCGVTSGGK